MRCDTCKRESDVVLRVVVAKDYNRALARPRFNCSRCYETKEQQRMLKAQGSRLKAGGHVLASSLQPPASSKLGGCLL